jgi:uncharacterized membrane protein YphA (DoxX/SURF4 family)
MFVWAFFENLGKGLYTPAGYAGLIHYYIKASSLAGRLESSHGFGGKPRRDGRSMQAMTEIYLGILLVIGLLTRPVAFVAFLYLGSLWVSEWGTSPSCGGRSPSISRTSFSANIYQPPSCLLKKMPRHFRLHINPANFLEARFRFADQLGIN